MAKVTRFKLKHEFNAFGKVTRTSLQPDENGNVISYDDYRELEQEVKELQEQNKRKDVFIKAHVEKWEGVESIDPSIQVLKRALGRVGESMGVPERLLNKESK